MSEVTSSPAAATDRTLKRDTLKLRHAIVISVAVMSPASIFFNTIPQASVVGAAIPLCFVIAFVITLFVANQYSEFSREIPSSGSSYTFVTAGLGPHLGYLTAWCGLIAVALGIPYTFTLLGANLEALIVRWFGLDLNWSFWYVLTLGIAFALCYWGIKQSTNVDLAFMVFEVGVGIILAVIVLFHVGQQGGLTLKPFTFGAIPAGGSLPVGVILAILTFIGFEAAAALGEETRNPHRSIPLAVFGSMILVGLFYVLVAYAGTVGYGIDKMVTGFANDAAPYDTISRHFSGPLLVLLVDIAGVASYFSASLAIINSGARVTYKVGRDGLLPGWIAWLHPLRLTPIAAIITLCSIGLISGLILGFTMTPLVAFGFLGTLDALFVMIVYALVCIASIVFFLRKRRAQFNILRHLISPVIGTIMIAVVFVFLLIAPAPPPLNAIPFVVLAWIVLGIVMLYVLRRRLAVVDTVSLASKEESAS
ncbi:MAG: APC family permease [Ktedonobacteraceae bacterium]|jgi:amino acid transporter